MKCITNITSKLLDTFFEWRSNSPAHIQFRLDMAEMYNATREDIYRLDIGEPK